MINMSLYYLLDCLTDYHITSIDGGVVNALRSGRSDFGCIFFGCSSHATPSAALTWCGSVMCDEATEQ